MTNSNFYTIDNNNNYNVSNNTKNTINEVMNSMSVYIDNSISEISNFSKNDVKEVFQKIIKDIVIFDIIGYDDDILRIKYNRYTTVSINILALYRNMKIHKIFKK